MALTNASLLTGVTDALKSGFCKTLDLTEPLGDPLAILVRIGGYGVGGTLGANQATSFFNEIRSFRTSARRWVCGGDPLTNPPAEYSGTIIGGQCVGTSYQFKWKRTLDFNGGSAPSTDTFTLTRSGPLKGIENQVEDIGGLFRHSAVLLRSPGNLDTELSATTRGYSSPAAFQDMSIFDVVPVGGGPNNCGDSPVDPPTGEETPTFTEDVTGEDDQGNPETLTDVVFNFSNPVLFQDGSISFQVEIESLEICGQVVIADDLTFSPRACKPSTSPTPEPGFPTGPGTNVPDEDFKDEDPEDETEEGETIIGVQVNSQLVTSTFSQSAVDNGVAPEAIVPRIGNVTFKIEGQTGDGTISAWTTPVPIQSVNAYIPAPTGIKVVRSEVSWLPQFSGQKTNVFSTFPASTPP